MNRASAILYSAIFAVLAPGTVAGFIPWYLTRWNFQEPFFHFYGFRLIGCVFIASGLPVLANAFMRFAIEGLGTPAPVLPTKHLVIRGPYRFVRNPMYVSVLALIFGQAFLFGDPQLLIYGIIVLTAFHLFVLLYEEPKLRQTYGVEYEEFVRNVPRWIPRFRTSQKRSGTG
jgi:protein-S-isoprenylcysteine O-methyltransferase Ste14